MRVSKSTQLYLLVSVYISLTPSQVQHAYLEFPLSHSGYSQESFLSILLLGSFFAEFIYLESYSAPLISLRIPLQALNFSYHMLQSVLLIFLVLVQLADSNSLRVNKMTLHLCPSHTVSISQGIIYISLTIFHTKVDLLCNIYYDVFTHCRQSNFLIITFSLH